MIPQTTIILCVKNRLELTRQTIETLKRNTYPKYRLLIMADNVDRDMAEYLNTLRAEVYFLKFGVFKDDNVGFTVSQDVTRALGVSISDTEYLYFTDNDVYFTDGWLEKLFKIYEYQPNAGIIGGRTHAYHKVLATFPTHKLTDQQSGYSTLMTKTMWNKCGLARKRFDDVGLAEAVLSHGHSIAQPIEPVLYHCGLTRSDGLQVIGYEEELKQPFPADCIRT